MFGRPVLRALGQFFLGCHRNASFLPLPNRELIDLRGSSTAEFLQGLMTNDIGLVKDTNSMMYALFLNPKGRIICDSLIYNLTVCKTSEPHFLVECDTATKAKLLKLLRFYNIRKKVAISEDTSSTDVWVGLPQLHDSITQLNDTRGVLFKAEDPRTVRGWSWRLIVDSKNSGFFERADDDINQKYRRMRFYLGLPEGSKELESNGEGLLPLEANADLCGGVSFTKGCYVGQELTARSRYVGVIRRRVAPIILQSPSDDERLSSGKPIYHVEKNSSKIVGNRPVGWIRAIEPINTTLTASGIQCGLAHLRLAECSKAQTNGDRLWVDLSGAENPISVDLENGVAVKAFAPSWWPSDVVNNLPLLEPFK